MQSRRRWRTDIAIEADRWALGASWPIGRVDWPHLVVSRPPLWCGVLLSFLEPSGLFLLWIRAIKCDILVHLDGFLIKSSYKLFPHSISLLFIRLDPKEDSSSLDSWL